MLYIHTYSVLVEVSVINEHKSRKHLNYKNGYYTIGIGFNINMLKDYSFLNLSGQSNPVDKC